MRIQHTQARTGKWRVIMAPTRARARDAKDRSATIVWFEGFLTRAAECVQELSLIHI